MGQNPIWTRSFRQRWHDALRSAREEGFSLVELFVAMSIAAIVLALVLATLPLFVQITNSGLALGQANDRADIALYRLERQVVSANVIFNPASTTTRTGSGTTTETKTTTTGGYSLRLYTVLQGKATCVQWRLLNGTLESRTWQTGDAAGASSWTPLVSHVDNATTHKAPFVLKTTKASPTSYAYRLLDVRLVLNAGTTKRQATKTDINASFSSVDAEYFSSKTSLPTNTAFCAPIPAP